MVYYIEINYLMVSIFLLYFLQNFEEPFKVRRTYLGIYPPSNVQACFLLLNKISYLGVIFSKKKATYSPTQAQQRKLRNTAIIT